MTNMPMYFGWFLLQQMTLAAMYSWWLMPLVSKGVRFEISPPLPFAKHLRHASLGGCSTPSCTAPNLSGSLHYPLGLN